MPASIQFLAGLALGYVMASFIESVAHQHISDAPNRYRLFWKRYPRLFRPLLETYFSHHVVHHVRTFRTDHVTQFSSDIEKARLDALLSRHGNHGELIRRARYAMKLQGDGGFLFVAPLLLAGMLIWVTCAGWVALGAVVTLAFPPVLSNWVHTYLHMPYRQACEESPGWISWILRTRYGRVMVRNHFMHHRHQGCYFNLTLGADYLRGTCRRPSPEDIDEMYRIGIPYGKPHSLRRRPDRSRAWHPR